MEIEEIHKIKCKACNCFVEYESVNDNLIKYKCCSCNKNYSNKIDKKFKKQVKNTFRFFTHNINNFILLLRKGVYWDKFNQTLLPKNEDFYCNLNMEDIKDPNCNHAKIVCKDFGIKNLISWFVS